MIDHEHLAEGIAAIECVRDDDAEAAALIENGWTPIQRCDDCSAISDDLTAGLMVAAAWGDADVHNTIEGQVLVRRATS